MYNLVLIFFIALDKITQYKIITSGHKKYSNTVKIVSDGNIAIKTFLKKEEIGSCNKYIGKTY